MQEEGSSEESDEDAVLMGTRKAPAGKKGRRKKASSSSDGEVGEMDVYKCDGELSKLFLRAHCAHLTHRHTTATCCSELFLLSVRSASSPTHESNR